MEWSGITLPRKFTDIILKKLHNTEVPVYLYFKWYGMKGHSTTLLDCDLETVLSNVKEWWEV